ncbi:MAG: hypothetical protein ACK55I_08050, partial [bacterium]
TQPANEFVADRPTSLSPDTTARLAVGILVVDRYGLSKSLAAPLAPSLRQESQVKACLRHRNAARLQLAHGPDLLGRLAPVIPDGNAQLRCPVVDDLAVRKSNKI